MARSADRRDDHESLLDVLKERSGSGKHEIGDDFL
jgi:hypothetical protein